MNKVAPKQPAKIKIKYIPSVVTLIVVVILGLGYWFFFQPIVLQLSNGGILDTANKARQLSTLMDYLAKQKTLVSEYEKISAKEAASVASMLPSEKDIPSLFVQLEALAKEGGFAPLYIETDEAAALASDANSSRAIKKRPVITDTDDILSLPRGVKKVTLSFKMGEGDYSDLKNFLNRLENNQRLLDVSSLRYFAKINAYDLTLNAYYIDELNI